MVILQFIILPIGKRDPLYFYNFIILLVVVSTFILSEMAPKAKDYAWAHPDVVDGVMYCKKLIKGGGIYRLKQHLAAIKGQVKACEAPLDVIGQIRADIEEQFNKFEEGKARQREIEEVGKKRRFAEMMGGTGTYAPGSIKGSSSIPSTNLRDPFQYVPPSKTTQDKGK